VLAAIEQSVTSGKCVEPETLLTQDEAREMAAHFRRAKRADAGLTLVISPQEAKGGKVRLVVQATRAK
jgi:hypothetical protein